MQSMRTYNKREVITFAKTTGNFGALSNMAKDFPLFINEIMVDSTETLYQALKFPFHPEIQALILKQSNPMRAKIVSRHYQKCVRPDWDKIKFLVMEWCLRVKLLQNWESFGNVLRSTGRNTIVEYSVKDNIWGASPLDKDFLQGVNALGRLLMKIREEYLDGMQKPTMVAPPNILGFLFMGYPVATVYAPEYYFNDDPL